MPDWSTDWTHHRRPSRDAKNHVASMNKLSLTPRVSVAWQHIRKLSPCLGKDSPSLRLPDKPTSAGEQFTNIWQQRAFQNAIHDPHRLELARPLLPISSI